MIKPTNVAAGSFQPRQGGEEVLQGSRAWNLHHVRRLSSSRQLFQLSSSGGFSKQEGKRFKSVSTQLELDPLDPSEIKDLPIEVVTRKTDALDLTFEVCFYKLITHTTVLTL